MIRRAAWRAVGLTEPPAAQRKKGRLHGRAAPFRGRTAPEAGELVAASGEPRRTGRRPLDAARRLRHPAAGRAPSRRAPAPRSAPPRPLHTWRAPGSARPHPRTAPAGSGGRREIFPGGRRRRVRGAVGAHRGAPGGADRGARARGRAGTRYRAHRKTRGLRARRFCSGSGVAPEPGVLAIDRARSIHEWGRRWRATALERRKCAKPRTCYRISYY